MQNSVVQDCSKSSDFVTFAFLAILQFIVEMHYKIAGAVHHRHRCHKLAGIEVLIDILGHRAAVSSTSKYVTIKTPVELVNELVFIGSTYTDVHCLYCQNSTHDALVKLNLVLFCWWKTRSVLSWFWMKHSFWVSHKHV